MMLIAYGI